MIIFGTRGITTTPNTGTFHCPNCQGDQDFRQRRVRRFFHLYFIPIIPLNTVGEYVECRACKDTYNTRVLSYNPAAAAEQLEAEYKAAIRSVMIHILLADGHIDDTEVDTVIDIYERISQQRLTQREVHENIDTIRRSGISFTRHLQALQGRLNDTGKETVLRSALMVALADGEFHESEQKMLTQVGLDLGMTPAHVKGVIHDTMSEPSQSVH